MKKAEMSSTQERLVGGTLLKSHFTENQTHQRFSSVSIRVMVATPTLIKIAQEGATARLRSSRSVLICSVPDKIPSRPNKGLSAGAQGRVVKGAVTSLSAYTRPEIMGLETKPLSASQP